MKHNLKNDMIALNLNILKSILTNTTARVSEAIVEIQKDNQNGAMGAIVDLEELLKQATYLYGAIKILHCTKLDPSLDAKANIIPFN